MTDWRIKQIEDAGYGNIYPNIAAWWKDGSIITMRELYMQKTPDQVTQLIEQRIAEAEDRLKQAATDAALYGIGWRKVTK